MYEHFVDHHLKDERCREREQLQKKRCNEDLAKESAVFYNRTEKPGDIEAPRQIHQPCPARNYDDSAVPYSFQLGLRHYLWSLSQRRQHQDLAVSCLAQQHEPAIA